MHAHAEAQRERRPYRTLVLNSDCRPLSTWPLSLIAAQDAVHALYRDRVTVLENWPDAFYHSPSIAIPVPKIVSLRHYAPVSATPKFCRRSILLRDRYRCQYCGEQFPSSELTFDHVIPRAKGGRTVWENILSACVRCNALKKDNDANLSGRRGHRPADGRLRPLKLPKQPTTAELLRAGLEFLPSEIVEDFGSWLWWNTELET